MGVRDEEQRRTFVPELAKEEFDVWAWEAVHGHKAQRGVFSDHWAADLPDVHPIGIISYQLKRFAKSFKRVEMAWGN